MHESLLDNAAVLTNWATASKDFLRQPGSSRRRGGDTSFATVLSLWTANLEGLSVILTTVEGIIGLKDRLIAGWLEVPTEFVKNLEDLTRTLKPSQTRLQCLMHRLFLQTAQIRLGDYREELRKSKAKKIASVSAKTAYDIYCTVLEEELNALYEEVEKDFSTYYRLIMRMTNQRSLRNSHRAKEASLSTLISMTVACSHRLLTTARGTKTEWECACTSPS